MKWVQKLVKDEDGAVIVIVALALVILLGCMALVVDAGVMYVNRSNMQNVADAAALAGAQDLPDKDAAKEKAIEYGALNGVVIDEDNVNPYYDDDKIEVTCSKNVPFYFARALGFENADVSARAVAQQKSQWDGEVLPFLNANNAFFTTGTKVEAWEKVDSGYFECIENYTIENNVSPYDNLYFDVNLDEGLQIKNGTVADKKQEIGYYYDTHKSSLTPTPYVYIFSFSPKAIADGEVLLMDGTVKDIHDLKNKSDYVSLDSLVLLKCTFDSYDIKKKKLYLTSIQPYDLGNDDPDHPFPDYPTNYVNPEGGGAILVE